jgi:hypothetical protein
MVIPNCRLNSTDKITHESRKADIQARNLQPVLRKAPEQTESPPGSQSVRRKTARTHNPEPTAFFARKERFGTISKGIARLL